MKSGRRGRNTKDITKGLKQHKVDSAEILDAEIAQVLMQHELELAEIRASVAVTEKALAEATAMLDAREQKPSFDALFSFADEVYKLAEARHERPPQAPQLVQQTSQPPQAPQIVQQTPQTAQTLQLVQQTAQPPTDFQSLSDVALPQIIEQPVVNLDPAPMLDLRHVQVQPLTPPSPVMPEIRQVTAGLMFGESMAERVKNKKRKTTNTALRRR